MNEADAKNGGGLCSPRLRGVERAPEREKSSEEMFEQLPGGPTGEEVIAPIQVFNCGNCGTMLPLGDVDELV